MSIKVNQFDVYKAEEELKKCPKIVGDYVKLLKEHKDNWQNLTRTVIKKIKESYSEEEVERLCKKAYYGDYDEFWKFWTNNKK